MTLPITYKSAEPLPPAPYQVLFKLLQRLYAVKIAAVSPHSCRVDNRYRAHKSVLNSEDQYQAQWLALLEDPSTRYFLAVIPPLLQPAVRETHHLNFGYVQLEPTALHQKSDSAHHRIEEQSSPIDARSSDN